MKPHVSGSAILALVALLAAGGGAGWAAPAPRNLAREATAASPHPPLRTARTADKANDGVAGDNAEKGWGPVVSDLGPGRPALLALTWERPVTIRKVVLRYLEGKSWHFVDFTLAKWDGPQPPVIGAPGTAFPHQDVFVGGHEGYHTFRIPALVVSTRGTLLAFCEGRRLGSGDWGDIDLLLKRSTDGGRTWGPLQVVQGEEGKVTIGNPVPIVDRVTGDIHLVHARNGEVLRYCVSRDDGATFSAPLDLTAPVRAMAARDGIEWGHVLPHPGHGLQCADGRLVVQIKTSGHKRGGPSRRVGAIFSTDHGRTWQPGGFVPATRGEASESTLFETADRTIVMNTRWHDGPYRLTSRSRDGGVTWSAPEPEPELPDPVCQGSILPAGNGRRVYFSNLVPEPSTSQIIAGRRSRLVVRASDDEGATWPAARVVVPGPAGYSDLALAPDGDLLVLFENGRMMYSEKLTLARIAPGVWQEQTARSRAEVREERYDYAQVRTILESPSWRPVATVRNSRATSAVEQAFPEPVNTRTLLLAISRVNQPGDLVYLQEIEVWGHD